MSVPVEFTREKVIEFLARILTGASRAQISREQCLEVLLQIAVDRTIDVKGRIGCRPYSLTNPWFQTHRGPNLESD